MIFGTHQENTLKQFADVASRAKRAVLCADGHYGHVMPVGGITAYDNLVSVPGVGPDIACFTGDTRIFTLDATCPALREVVGQEIYVLASTPEGTPVATKAIVHRTKGLTSLVSVTLDNGRSVRCTPDHRFLRRDGTYCEAQHLTPETSLMPFYACMDRDGYVLVRDNASRTLLRLQQVVFRSGLLGATPLLEGNDVLVIHHKNRNKVDNSPMNLEPMSNRAHGRLHGLEDTNAHFNDPEFTRKRLDGIAAFWEDARQDEAFMAQRRKQAAINGRTGTLNHPEAYVNNGLHGADALRQYNTDPTTIAKARARAKIPRSCPLCDAQVWGPNGLYRHAQTSHPAELVAGRRKGRSKSGLNAVAERLVLGANNHKVVSVVALQEQEEVFCLSVPGYNNFALADGVFVHNCGNAAIRTDAMLSDFTKADLERIADDVNRTISFGMGRSNAADDAPTDDPLFDSPAWSLFPLEQDVPKLKDKARAQLGTVGSGNHYVDVFADEHDRIWVGVHFGSRGLGFTIGQGFWALGQDLPWNKKPREEDVLYDLNEPLGHAYWGLMELAGEYAYAGREWVTRKVVELLGARELELVHNHHNFAWKEVHDGVNYVVVRKGATPAWPGQRGFVGGSMGDNAVILEGVATPMSEDALYSTVHGAGRVMSRKAARGKMKGWGKKAKIVAPGLVSQSMMDEWLTKKGVIRRGGGLDESPHVYRRLPEVLAAHGMTINVLHTLRPLIAVMAAPDVIDPFKD